MDRLGEYLSTVQDIPVATQERLESVGPNVVLQFGEVHLDGMLPGVGPIDEPDVVDLVANNVFQVEVAVGQTNFAFDGIRVRGDQLQDLLDVFGVRL